MKPKHYLLSLAAFGLLIMVLVTFYLAGRSILTLLANYFPPLLLGGTFTLGLAGILDYYYADRKLSVLGSVLGSVALFSSGVIVGALLNFALYGRFQEQHSLYWELFDWFVKPVYWLGVIGTPCAILVGLLIHGAWALWQKRKALSISEGF